MPAVQVPRFAYALCRAVAPGDVRVESQATVDGALTLPLAVVACSPPSSVSNGPIELSADFALSVQCYADDIDQAYDLARHMYDGLIAAWRAGMTTEYGWIAHIDNNSLQPHRVVSDIDDDDSFRFDVLLNIVARNDSH